MEIMVIQIIITLHINNRVNKRIREIWVILYNHNFNNKIMDKIISIKT
jgi:hypothetical protein